MKRKWYLQTWFICLLFAFSQFIIPAIVGIILLIKQIIQDHELGIKYGAIDKLDNTITLLNKQIEQRNNHLSEIKGREDNLYSSIKDLNKEINSLKDEIASLEKDTICTHYSFSDYDALSSEECKNKLALLRQEEQEAIKSDSVLKVEISSNKKKVIAVSKQILRCFDSECENILLNLSVKNIDSSRNKITRSFETLNKLYVTDGISMKNNLLEYKLKELNLVYTYELKKEQERELQKAIKEQMIEEEKVRKEIEQKKAKLEKDQNQCNNEIHKLMGYMQKSQDDVEKQLYIDKIKELEDKINQLEGEKSAVLEREANARAGYVYVISNIGSFGDDVYKIGMTRRLEPMDRIKELSSASVPFEFDVHAMIFSDDAPALETALHQTFNGKRVNMVNTHKEFFRVSLDEIEATVKANYNETVTFTRIPVAKEYNETLEILGQGRHSLVS